MDAGRGRPQLHHVLDGAGDDTVAGTDASGMHGGDDPGLVVGEQDRHTVGGEDGQGDPGQCGHQSVRHLHRCSAELLEQLDGHFGDVRGMDLLHVDHVRGGQADQLGETGTVGGHGTGIITDVVGEVAGRAVGDDFTDGPLSSLSGSVVRGKWGHRGHRLRRRSGGRPYGRTR